MNDQSYRKTKNASNGLPEQLSSEIEFRSEVKILKIRYKTKLILYENTFKNFS